MNLTSCFKAFGPPFVGATLLLGAGACARQEGMPYPQAPLVTSAPIAPAPRPTIVVSPNVSVSDDIATACRLQFDDIGSAPKFDFDQSAIGPQDVDILSQIAKCVTTGPLAGRALELVGRADPRGESEYNMALGGRRASSVGESLSRLGVESARVTQTSRGKLDATGLDEEGWKRDRRVDILLR